MSYSPLPSEQAATVSLSGATKSFGSPSAAKVVLGSIDLTVKAGERVAIIGANGSGKSTLLRVIAGLEPLTSGTVSLQSKASGELNIGFVFQSYGDSLLPWLSCSENICFPLAMSSPGGWKSAEGAALSLIEELGFKIPLSSKPGQMSGGEKQLAAIARALVVRPGLLMLDEPFSSLDFPNRRRVVSALSRDWEAQPKTTLIVSHELDEAIFLADRIIILEPGSERAPNCVEVPFPRPRALEVLDSEQLAHFRRQLLEDHIGEELL